MTLLHHHQTAARPFEEPPDETAWLWQQRRELAGLVEQLRRENGRLQREADEARRALAHHLHEHSRRKRRWRR